MASQSGGSSGSGGCLLFEVEGGARYNPVITVDGSIGRASNGGPAVVLQGKAVRMHKRITEVLRKALNLAVRWGWIERNPASGGRRNPEPKRARYLGRNDVSRLMTVLREHPERNSADALLFMLLTGCRRGEALNAQWTQFDLTHNIWTKLSTETKQRREHRIPYSTAVAEILQRRRLDTEGAFVFPGRSGSPLTEVRRTWQNVCAMAELDGVRIHDLRHTFASLLASSGQSLLVVGELLGHSSPQTTKRYANLYDDSL